LGADDLLDDEENDDLFAEEDADDLTFFISEYTHSYELYICI
jgi:hypothetical protein